MSCTGNRSLISPRFSTLRGPDTGPILQYGARIRRFLCSRHRLRFLSKCPGRDTPTLRPVICSASWEWTLLGNGLEIPPGDLPYNASNILDSSSRNATSGHGFQSKYCHKTSLGNQIECVFGELPMSMTFSTLPFRAASSGTVNDCKRLDYGPRPHGPSDPKVCSSDKTAVRNKGILLSQHLPFLVLTQGTAAG